MDFFKQKNYLIFVIILLIIMNLGTLLVLWIGRPPHPPAKRGPLSPEKEKARIEKLLKEELGFDNVQTAQYLKMRKTQSEKVLLIQDEIRQLKEQMFDAVLKDDPQPMLSDSLLKLSQEKMGDLERLTFQYLLDMKKLCKPEQQDKLKILMNEFFRQNTPRGMKNDGPPPPGH